MAGPVHGVDQEDVLPAVVIVVKEADAAAHGLRQIFFPERSVLCMKWIPAWAVTSVNSIGPEGRGVELLEAIYWWRWSWR